MRSEQDCENATNREQCNLMRTIRSFAENGRSRAEKRDLRYPARHSRMSPHRKQQTNCSKPSGVVTVRAEQVRRPE